jgi:hypothetical protein
MSLWSADKKRENTIKIISNTKLDPMTKTAIALITELAIQSELKKITKILPMYTGTIEVQKQKNGSVSGMRKLLSLKHNQNHEGKS